MKGLSHCAIGQLFDLAADRGRADFVIAAGPADPRLFVAFRGMYVYSRSAPSIDGAALVRVAAEDGFELTLTREAPYDPQIVEAFECVARGDVGLRQGEESSFGSVKFWLYVSAMNDDDREALADAVAESSRATKAAAKKCVTKFHLFFDGLPDPDGLALMTRVAYIIATRGGGVCDDELMGETRAFPSGAALPKWVEQFMLRDQVGARGVRVVDWCDTNGYRIPPRFFDNDCARYVFLITSRTPPMLHAQTFELAAKAAEFFATPPAGYVYRAFDFEADVELVADANAADGFRALGPIAGLMPMSVAMRTRRLAR